MLRVSFTTLLLASLLLVSHAGNFHDIHTRHRKSLSLQTRQKTFTLVDNYFGSSFLTDWDFFNQTDPTHGLVNYLNYNDAVAKNLAFVQSDNTTILAVDSTTTLQSGQPRNSVRISSKKTYNGGLFIMDSWEMPHGCALWPSFWSVGPNWPSGGEIDVVEGANGVGTNQMTLHTSSGCNLANNTGTFTGTPLGLQCESSGADNNGCAFVDTDARSFGASFNQAQGGVFAHLWDTTGIKVWHFARASIPADIEARSPNPTGWGTPSAFWSFSSCDQSHFAQHQLVFDTTLCGDWAGSSFTSNGCPGTCQDAVANPANFQTARWNIRYVAVYQ